MKRWGALIIVAFTGYGFIQNTGLKGTWQYAGGITKGVYYAAPQGYRMQRVYTDTKFEAFLLEKGEPALKYEAGNYTIKTDSCIETQTFSLQGQQMIGIAIHYKQSIRNDTLILKGVLPNGAAVEDYWKKVK